MRTTRQLLGARIKELRKKRGLTQDQLAEKVGLATRYISLIEVGRSSPSLESIDSIACALEVELKALFDFSHLDPDEVSPEALDMSLSRLGDANRRLLYRLAELMNE